MSNIKKGRKSVFKEIGLDPDNSGTATQESEKHVVRDEKRCDERTHQETHSDLSPPSKSSYSPETHTNKTSWYSRLATGKRPQVRTGSNAPPSAMQPLSTLTMLVLAVAVVAPLAGRANRETVGIADAGPVVIRTNSPTDVCARWAQQSASILYTPINITSILIIWLTIL